MKNFFASMVIVGTTVLYAEGQSIVVAEPITGDQARAEVHWKSRDLTNFNGKTASPRLTLRRAQLYSFWFE